MAEAATKASKPSMAPRSESPVTTRMREQPKKLPEAHFQFKNKAQGLFTVILPKTDMTFEDVMRPDFWAQVASKMVHNPAIAGEDYRGSEITVFGAKREWKAELTITAIRADAMDMVCTGPQIDPNTGKCCPVDLKTGKPYTSKKSTDSAKAA